MHPNWLRSRAVFVTDKGVVYGLFRSSGPQGILLLGCSGATRDKHSDRVSLCTNGGPEPIGNALGAFVVHFFLHVGQLLLEAQFMQQDGGHRFDGCGVVCPCEGLV